MRRLYYVNREMCGGADLPNDFDLDDFCEVPQGKLEGVEVVPVTEPESPSGNRSPEVVPESVFYEALGEYLQR